MYIFFIYVYEFALNTITMVPCYRKCNTFLDKVWTHMQCSGGFRGGCIGCTCTLLPQDLHQIVVLLKSFPTRSSLSKSAQGFQSYSKIHQLGLIFLKFSWGRSPKPPTSERGKHPHIPFPSALCVLPKSIERCTPLLNPNGSATEWGHKSPLLGLYSHWVCSYPKIQS